MIVDSDFQPSFWAKNRHLQTLWGALFKRMPKLPESTKKRLEFKDGDFVDLDIYDCDQISGNETVLLLHGLEGSSESHYIAGLARALLNEGQSVIVKHFRGCSGESNRLLRSYHSGVSDDLEETLEQLKAQGIDIDYICGFSLGGNVLLKWLGENPLSNKVKAAVAVSVPLSLSECAKSINQGFSKLYQKHLLDSLKEKTKSKFPEISDTIRITAGQVDQISNFEEFDELVTARLNGFEGAGDYYQRVSSRQFLGQIKVPTLIIHAEDDPFMNTSVIPSEQELSEAVTFELSQHGGHVGFVEGASIFKPGYYLEKRIPAFFRQIGAKSK